MSLHTHRTHLPLLTLASVLLPLRAFDGTAAAASQYLSNAMGMSPGITTITAIANNSFNDLTKNVQENINNNNNNDGENKKESNTQGKDELHVANACMYDRATIRYILRNFWQVRVQQYTRQL